MTMKEILHFAYDGALAKWAYEKSFLDASPNNHLAQVREQNAWEKLESVRDLLLEEERKESA